MILQEDFGLVRKLHRGMDLWPYMTQAVSKFLPEETIRGTYIISAPLPNTAEHAFNSWAF